VLQLGALSDQIRHAREFRVEEKYKVRRTKYEGRAWLR